jgi:hypothetical protein
MEISNYGLINYPKFTGGIAGLPKKGWQANQD